jgi:hypothetical protein
MSLAGQMFQREGILHKKVNAAANGLILNLTVRNGGKDKDQSGSRLRHTCF